MQNEKTITIDPETALRLLNDAVATIQTNRQGHEVLATCIQVLRARIVSDQERIAALESLLAYQNDQTLAEAENGAHGANGAQETASQQAVPFPGSVGVDYHG